MSTIWSATTIPHDWQTVSPRSMSSISAVLLHSVHAGVSRLATCAAACGADCAAAALPASRRPALIAFAPRGAACARRQRAGPAPCAPLRGGPGPAGRAPPCARRLRRAAAGAGRRLGRASVNWLRGVPGRACRIPCPAFALRGGPGPAPPCARRLRLRCRAPARARRARRPARICRRRRAGRYCWSAGSPRRTGARRARWSPSPWQGASRACHAGRPRP